MKRFIVTVASVVLLTGAWMNADGATTGPAEFGPLFGAHMVLQRDQAIPVWGSAAAGTRLTVRLGDSSAATVADTSGRWRVELPAMPAGGPHRMVLLDGDVEAQTLEDIQVGDVFLCSGQSNMEWPVSRSSGASRNLFAPDAQIRLLTVAKYSTPAPLQAHASAPEWVVADEQSIAGFSAVCWFFARDLRGSMDLPIGLINASWGGSQIEAWISARALARVDGYEEQLDLLRTYSEDRSAGAQRFGATWEAWWRQAMPGQAPWDVDAAADPAWKPAPATMGDWKAYGDPDLANHLGMVWFRKDFELDVAQGATLHLGGIDEVDATWVSGHFAGAQFGWGTPREYAVPEGFLQPGRNSVTVNVLNTWGQGGMIGPAEQVGLRLDDGRFLPLSEGWKYRAVDTALGGPPRAPWESVGGLTGMYNAMIAPLAGLRLSGMLWYQGESNTGRAQAYAPLLGALIADWRELFGDQALPFMLVQLPGFGPMANAPLESGWAELRDAQRRVTLADPHTGMASIMDVGDPHDIHPANKQVVGQRLAAIARSLVYDAPGQPDGAAAISARREGSDVVVDFSASGLDLAVHGSGQVAGFELCGNAPGTCAFTTARLEGVLVRLTAPDAARVTRVRHAWADTPIVNLYATGGVPVGSFEVPISD